MITYHRERCFPHNASAFYLSYYYERVSVFFFAPFSLCRADLVKISKENIAVDAEWKFAQSTV